MRELIFRMAQDWRKQGKCRGVDPEVFYPVNDGDAAQAKEICDGCPVRQPCLEWALADRERYGVWGGMTERERRRLLRHRRMTA